MNQKRWIAVGIAAGLLMLSGVSDRLSTKPAETKQQMNEINKLLYGSEKLEEKVVEEGSAKQKIVKLSVDGTIMNTGESGLLATTSGYNHQQFLKQLDTIEKDPTVKGILLEVNSPGGGVYESAEIARQFDEIKAKRKIPLYVAMKNTAASGGYYISAGADKIFATPETVTGSIGVIMSNMNVTGLMEKLGIKDATYKSGALKDMGSPTHEPSEEEKQVLQTYIDSSYNRFVDVVAKGRKMDKEKVKKIADGRIYDGTQAKENGLVDALGYPDEALTALKKDKKLNDAQVIEYATSSTGFMNSFFGSQLAEWQGFKMSDEQIILNYLKGDQGSPRAMFLYGGE